MDIFNSDNVSDVLSLLKALFEHAVDGIILIDKKGTIVSSNPAAAQLFSYTKEEMLGNNVRMLMETPHHENHDGYLHSYKTTGIKKIIGKGREVEGKRKDGSLFHFHLSISEVKSSGMHLFAGVIHDISEVKRANEKVESSRQKWEAIVKSAVDSIIIIRDRGEMTDANEAACQLFGYSVEELFGNNVKMLMPEPYHSEHDGYLDNYHKTQKPQIIGIGRDVEGQKKDGTIFPLRLAVSEFVLGDEKFFAGIIQDLTEKREAEKRIKELNAELEKKVKNRTEELADVVNKLLSTNNQLKGEIEDRRLIEQKLHESKQELEKLLEKEKELGELKSRFVSTASHEFRTPLSTILSSVSLISRYVKEEEQGKRDKHIHRIKSAVEHLNGILNDFLSLSKLEEGRVRFEPSLLDWSEYVNEILDLIKVNLKKEQYITYNSPSINRELSIDGKLMRNVLFNLFSNAIKYSDEGKEILLETVLEGEYFMIKVQDFGMGIPEDDQEYLFTRFHRARNATNISGTGLGLNIVQRYVNLMGGEINFVSKVNEGTTFHIKIPIQ